MLYVGIDVASEDHVFAVVDEHEHVQVKPTSFREEEAGYRKLMDALGDPSQTLVAMEATGHYWKNLFAALSSQGFPVVLLNALATRRHAQAQLERTKTDAVDALNIACLIARQRPRPTRLTDTATEELRELVRLRSRTTQQMGDRVRDLHRLVDLGFPEFTRHVKQLDSSLATTILHRYPTARSFAGLTPRTLAKVTYDTQGHKVGLELATALIEAACHSVGAHHGDAYRVQIRYANQDIDLLRSRLREIDEQINSRLDDHEIGQLLTTIGGIGKTTAARLVAELGDPSQFDDAKALCAFVGVVPGLKLSGKKRGGHAALCPIGHAQLRAALWMPTLVAVRVNPWLRRHYERFLANGKPRKVALIACMHKLLMAVYSVAKNRRPFTPKIELNRTSPVAPSPRSSRKRDAGGRQFTCASLPTPRA